MKRLLRYPLTNAIGLSLFTGFYTLVFLTTPKSVWLSGWSGADCAVARLNHFWDGWRVFLLNGSHAYIAWAMVALTVVVVVLLMRRSHAYDEYHTSLLVSCLTAASVLTLVAIAAFYLIIRYDSQAAFIKLTLFIVVNWVTVVVSDLVFVLLCRWK